VRREHAGYAAAVERIRSRNDYAIDFATFETAIFQGGCGLENHILQPGHGTAAGIAALRSTGDGEARNEAHVRDPQS
jgi:hypothetical protein